MPSPAMKPWSCHELDDEAAAVAVELIKVHGGEDQADTYVLLTLSPSSLADILLCRLLLC